MENKILTLTTNPLEVQGNDEVATIWRDNEEGSTLIAHISASPGFKEGQEFGKKLTASYNNTYGKGINPEAVGELWSVVDCLIKYETTIRDEGVDLNDYYWFRLAKAAIDKSIIKQ